MRFDTPLTITGPFRAPKQMLADQAYDGHSSVHDEATAASMGLKGAPIEGPTHFSQFDPIGVQLFGDAWFERGCISTHFQTMVIEGEEVQASAVTTSATHATITATKSDGAQVLVGTISVGPDHNTELDRRRAAQGNPGELFIVDRVAVGMRRDETEPAMITRNDSNGNLYPFSLSQKLDDITETHPWYTDDGAQRSPWKRAVVPFEMMSILAQKQGPSWPVRTPSLGLFLDLEVRMLAGPVFVDTPYLITREVVGRSQSRRVESYWTRSIVTDPSTGADVAMVLLHSGVFKDSYAGYPAS